MNFKPTNSPKYAIGKGNRTDLTGTVKLPGPGQYDINDSKNKVS